MLANIYLLSSVLLFIQIINAVPRYRLRRQINDGFANNGQPAVSGSIGGTSYYGVGADPNYGSFIPIQNNAGGGGILPISYNPSSNLNSYLVNPNQPQQSFGYNNNNNGWQRPNYNQQGNRYAPGSQGWYATGENYWYSNGQSITLYPCLIIMSILFLIILQ